MLRSSIHSPLAPLISRNSISLHRPLRTRSHGQVISEAEAHHHLGKGPTLIKICGVTTPEDAELGARAGADFIGMIMWSKAKRAVSVEKARQIVERAKQHHAQPAGVFVDEDAGVILDTCSQAGLEIAQLHGEGARAAVWDLPESLQVIYVMHVDASGALQTLPPAQLAEAAGRHLSRSVEWVLLDGMTGGSGEPYDWAQVKAPEGIASKGWLLAGGLGPHNVAEAVQALAPTGVDVSSGVTDDSKLRKDPAKVHAFVSSVQQCP